MISTFHNKKPVTLTEQVKIETTIDRLLDCRTCKLRSQKASPRPVPQAETDASLLIRAPSIRPTDACTSNQHNTDRGARTANRTARQHASLNGSEHDRCYPVPSRISFCSALDTCINHIREHKTELKHFLLSRGPAHSNYPSYLYPLSDTHRSSIAGCRS